MSFLLSPSPIDPSSLNESFAAPGAGAFCAFEGRVRDRQGDKAVAALEYEAHAALCEKEAKKIFDEAMSQFPILDAHVVHRTGRVNVGEVSVWIGVLAAHRDASFKACRYLIDELKKRLPIWKKEYYADGTSDWVNDAGEHQDQTREEQFYARQVLLPEIGTQGQAKLKKARILVVGAGGLGSPALTSLAEAGVGTIGICDDDILNEDNLHRQGLYTHADIGQPKAVLAAEKLRALNPYISINVHVKRCTPDNVEELILTYDIVLDCTDNFKTKFLLNDACLLNEKPLVQASIHQWEGQLRVWRAQGDGCLRCLWPEIPNADCIANCAQAGVLGAVVNIIGHMQALETIKLILGVTLAPASETCLIDLTNYTVRRVRQSLNPACPLCGENPEITAIEASRYAPAQTVSIDITALSMEKLKGYTFIDVREDIEIAHDPAEEIESVRLPMSRFGSVRYEFDAAKPYIVFCAKGMRSLRIAQELREHGIPKVFSLEGGVDAIHHYFKTHAQSTRDN